MKIYNSASQKKEDFVPLQAGQVKMYCCGPTVYDLLHVGNFRGAIFFNLVRNWLEQSGYQVTYVYNYTDVDDKIINRAKKDGTDSAEVARHFIAEFEKDYDQLGLRRATHNPRVTEHMTTIVALIEDLIAKGRAYVSGGDVFYSVKSFAAYGELSHRKLEDLQTAVRIDLNEQKKEPLDFALWKAAKSGEPSWASPWGPGRPGWHIECSAMIRALLGDQIDIHGGGLDLLFPHHENERAQSEGASEKPFVRYWMHNNMIEFGGAKMSKSLGNVRTAREFMKAHSPEMLKYLILSVHYRSVCDFSENTVENVTRNLARVYSALARASRMENESDASGAVAGEFAQLLEEQKTKMRAALDDDFNTPEAFGHLFEVIRKFNQIVQKNPRAAKVAQSFLAFVREWSPLLSLFQEEPEAFLRRLDDQLLAKAGLQREEIQKKVEQRLRMRSEKNWAAADAARDELVALGISLQDTRDGTTWEVAK